MVFTVYKTTNLLNNHIYIEVHSTNNPYDSYKGSGKIIKQAFKLYGKSHFVKEVLFIYENSEEAYAKEKELVNEEFVGRVDTYNLATGGSTSPTWEEDRKAKQKGRVGFMRGKTHSEETKRRIALASKGRIHSATSRRRISEGQRGRTSANKGVKQSIEVNKKRSESHLKILKLVCPHCGKVCDPGNAKQWHFDNCRSHHP